MPAVIHPCAECILSYARARCLTVSICHAKFANSEDSAWTSQRNSLKVTEMEKNTSSYIRKENKNVNSHFGDAEKFFMENGGRGGIKIW